MRCPYVGCSFCKQPGACGHGCARFTEADVSNTRRHRPGGVEQTISVVRIAVRTEGVFHGFTSRCRRLMEHVVEKYQTRPKSTRGANAEEKPMALLFSFVQMAVRAAPFRRLRHLCTHLRHCCGSASSGEDATVLAVVNDDQTLVSLCSTIASAVIAGSSEPTSIRSR